MNLSLKSIFRMSAVQSALATSQSPCTAQISSRFLLNGFFPSNYSLPPFFSHHCHNHAYQLVNQKSIFRMSAAQVHWLLARALAPRNFITIPVNWDFPQAHLSCCLVYKYDAPQVKLCHFDSDTPFDTSFGSSEFPRRGL